MAILPQFSSVENKMSPWQTKCFAAEHYLLIIFYGVLTAIIMLNSWTIFVRQRKFKQAPLLFFYVYAFIDVTDRLVFLISMFSSNYADSIMIVIYTNSKVCIGLIHSWIVFEIMTRTSRLDIEEGKLKCARIVALLLINLGFSSVAIVSITLDLGSEDCKGRSFCFPATYLSTYAFVYLAVAIVMTSVNCALMSQIRKKNRQIEARSSSGMKNVLRSEQKILLIVLFLFMTSYCLGAIYDMYLAKHEYVNQNEFSLLVSNDFVFFLDGATLLALLLVHRRNFTVARDLFTTQRAASTQQNETTAASTHVYTHNSTDETCVLLPQASSVFSSSIN